MSKIVEIEIKYLGISGPSDMLFDCDPKHKLIQVIKSFLEGIDFSPLWFEFYDSKREWLSNTEQTVADYLTANRPIILCKKRVALKFRVLQDPTFTDWCLNHGRKIDKGPIPEIARTCGFDSELLLKTVCEEFGEKNGFSNHRLNFFNSDGEDIFDTLPQDVNLVQYFKLFGPIIFYTYQAGPNCDYFYLNVSHDPHSVPKRFKHFEGMAVDDLSLKYKYRHSSLMAIDNGDIVGFANASDPVQRILNNDTMTYRLGNLYRNHNDSEDHFDISVRFINGGDRLMNPMLVCAFHNETIKRFSQRLFAKVFETAGIVDCLELLRIDMGGEIFKCNSSLRITKPPESNFIGFCIVDAAPLPPYAKYCNYEYQFYFYDKTQPWHRVKSIYENVSAHNPAKLSSVIDKFNEWMKFTPKNCVFFNSQGDPIESKHRQSTVAEYARKNDLVIFYVKTTSD